MASRTAIAPSAPPAPTTRTPFVIAHRAGNELPRLRLAQQLAIPLIEADLHWFAGRIEVRHLKTLGPLPVLWDRWYLADPRTPRLLLDELLAAAAPGTELMLDLKGSSPELPATLAETLRRWEPGRPVTVCARRWALLEPLRGLPGVRLVGSAGSARQLARLERTSAGSLDGVSIHRRLLDARVVDRLRSRIELVMSWPVTGVEEARTLAAWGVQGLIAERFELLAPALAAEGWDAR